MARRRGLSFRVKLSLVAIVVAVVPLIAVGFVVDDRYEDGLSDANRDWIQEVADNLLGVATTTFERATSVLAGIHTALADASRAQDERLAIASALVATHPALVEVGVYDDKGARIDVIRLASATPVRLPATITPPSAGQRFGAVHVEDGEAYVTVFEPLVTDARAWWLVGELSLVDLARRVDAAAESPNSRRGRAVVAVVDTSLRVLLSSEEALAGKIVGPDQLATLTGVEGRTLDKGLRVDARFARGSEPMLGAIRTIQDTPFAVVVEIPERYVLYTVSQVRRWVIAAIASAILAAIVVGLAFARRMTRPIHALVDFASDLGRRRFGTTVRVRSNDELGLVGDALEQAASDLAASDEQIRREQAIRTDLGRYLPRPLVDQIVERRRELSLGGDRRDITVLFADVVGFTPLTERQSAETVVTMLNELFTILTEIVFRHGGMVDKFIGDSVMAIWNAPEAQDDHATRAVSAAEDMLRWLEVGNESWRERFGFTVELAIGINSGEAVVGNFGSETRMEFTAIGDTVNVAARLESIAPPEPDPRHARRARRRRRSRSLRGPRQAPARGARRARGPVRGAHVSSRVGSVIAERYRLDRELGDGGSATVYRAVDLQLGREVAVKMLRKKNMLPELVVRFEREARVGAALSHPHVVQTLDFGRSEGTLFLVTQLVEGGDLHRFYVAHAPLSIELVVAIGAQIAHGLMAAHEIGLVHRDLKPENILLDPGPSPWVRIADFGLAYIDDAIDPRQGRLTTDGMVSGTPTYMAPEQVSDGAIGPHSDVYAFGCLLYELLLGAPPFVGSHGKVFADHLYAPPRPPRLVHADVPGGLDELVLRMLAKAPADRPTAQIVHRRLLAFEAAPHAPQTEHGRSTDARASRAERMLTRPPPLASLAPAQRAPRAVRVGISGDPPLDLLAALEVADVDAVPAEETADAVIALDASVEDIARLVARQVPVIADATARDFERVTALLRIGVAEVVMRPLVPAIVVSKLQRALRRRMEKT